MRDLIISIACMLVLIIPWGIYSRYSVDITDSYNQIIDNELLPAITVQNWDKAEKEFNSVVSLWENHKKASAYFCSTESINDIDGTMKKAGYYLKMHDKSNTSGEIAYLRCKLNFIYNNESMTFSNIL